MKKYLISILLIILCTNTEAVVYSENTAVEFFNDTEVIVADGVVISAANGSFIPMYVPVYLYNNGTINNTIDTNGYNLFVYNTVDNATLNTIGGNVVQIISGIDEIRNLNVVADNFTIKIQNVSNLNFSDIQHMNADAFEITDSSVVISDFTQWQNWDKHMTASGVIHLIITDENATEHDGEYIQNLSGAESVDVQIPGLDGAVRSDREYSGGQFKLEIVRNTDYNTANNGENSVVEKIKESAPNDKLVQAFNSAHSTDEINQIKKKSYRFNHEILLRPIRVINNFALIDNVGNKPDVGVGIMPVYVTSGKISDIGGRLYFGDKYDDFYFNIGLNFNRFEYSDNINDFSGVMYGTDFYVQKYIGKIWLNGVGGFNLTRFHANYVSSNSIKNNPYGISWYGGLDSGYDFNIGSDVIVSPWLGIGIQSYKVTDVSDTDYYARAGADIRYSFVVDGIKYEYSLNGGIVSNGNLFSSIKIGFWSITDEAGVSANVGILKDDIDYNYQLSLNAKMLF